ncbi:MAG: hypothetical protein GYB68_10940 [Chloroflexi bacterium]|nr:hypothetical protein [Chloroflexota bacterium]
MSSQYSPDERTQAELLSDLRDGSPAEQERALKRLAAVGEAEALDAVIDYLRDQPDTAQADGLNALRILAHKYLPADRYGLAEVMLNYLTSDNWQRRLTAARLLNTHPNELAVGTLRDVVDEALEKVTQERKRRFSSSRIIAERTLSESIMALANCGRLSVLPEILDLLDYPPVRPIATRALGVIGSETERDHLEDLCEDDNVHVRDAAQWALGLMDERIEQLMRPPDEIPEPPPDRVSPLYWAHRQLDTEADDLVQFLVVRVGIEHLMLDALLSENRVPEVCTITVRRFEGRVPPDGRQRSDDDSDVVGIWRYYWQGPTLVQLSPEEEEEYRAKTRHSSGSKRDKGREQSEASIIISYPVDLEEDDEGLVGFDCLFGPFFGRGWIYRIAWRNDDWGFSQVRRTWTG